MSLNIYVYDPTVSDPLSKVRGVGRYLQILKENFSDLTFTNKLPIIDYRQPNTFINPFFNFLQPPLTLRRLAKKQIAVIHDLIPLKYPQHFPVGIKGKLNIFLNKLALKNYDLVVTDSEASKRDIVKILGIDENIVKVVYPCLPKIFSISKSQIPISNFQTNFKFQISNFCLYVGDATWNKNLVNLAKAIKIINVTCVFVGKVFSNQLSVVSAKTEYRKPNTENYLHPWQQEVNEFRKEAEGDKRFIFLGYVSDEKLIQLYQRARCNVLISRDEGFGFSYLEAASQSCPSVLSDIQVLHETSNNQGALFVNPDDPNAIANAVGEVYFNKDLRSKLGALAKDREKYFSSKKFVNEFHRMLSF